jgi:hypothetical protein
MALNDYEPVINEAAQSWNLDPGLLKALILQESGGNPGAVSKKGAVGLTGLMPQTAAQIGVTNLKDPLQQIYGGAAYLSKAMDAEKNNPQAALLYYHGGPGWRTAYGPESAGYVPGVAANYAKVAKGQGQPAASTGIPSDDDFLNSIAPKASSPPASQPTGVPSDDDFLKTIGVAPQQPGAPVASQAEPSAPTTEGGKVTTAPSTPVQNTPAPSPTPTATQTTPNDISGEGRDQYGNPLYPLAAAPSSEGVSIGQAALQGAAQGFGTQPLGLSPQTQNVLSTAGVYPPANGGGTIVQNLNKNIINPLATVGDLALRTGNALYSGAANALRTGASQLPQGHQFTANSGTPLGRYVDESLTSLTSPQLLANDLTAAPEAFAGSPNPAGVPRVAEPVAPNPLASWNPAEVPWVSQELRENPGVTTPQTLTTKGPSEPNPLAPTPETPLAPRSAGAAGTPNALSNLTAAQQQAYRSVAEGQKLNEPQPVGVPDYRELVPGVQPTQADLEQQANISREQKMVESQIPDEFKEVAAANNDARSDHFASLAGSDVDVQNAIAARSAQAEKDLAAAFNNRKPTDAQPVIDTIQNMLSDPRDKENTQLRQFVAPYLDRLQNDDGTLKNDPLNLYGIREDINRQLMKANSKLPTEESNNLKFVTGQLSQVKDALDQVIEKGAPGYQQYLENFSNASRPIDAMQALQGFENKLYDSQGRMQLSRVQGMMKNIVDARSAPGVNQFKSIPDETMQQLWNLRDDLRRVAGSQELAKARGSDTVQNAMDVAKDVAGTAGMGVAHALVSHIPGGNAALSFGQGMVNSLMSESRKRQLQARAAQMARPSTPLQPPGP